MNYTYILECSDHTYYCGWTNDPEKRLAAHNEGKGGKYTRARRPVVMVYTEAFETKEEAMSREWHIKQLTRAQKEALIRSGTDDYSLTNTLRGGQQMFREMRRSKQGLSRNHHRTHDRQTGDRDGSFPD